jgi:Uma2 family endonuclease
MTIGLKQVLDYGDYACIPPDGKRYELLEGDLHVTPAPSPLHQWVSKRLQRQLEAYFEARGLGRVFNAPLDVILTPHDVVQPDLVVVTDSAQLSARGIEGAPALLVEVLSPGTVSYDRATKSRRYAALGVPHLWLLDPDSRRLECYRLEGSGYRSVIQAEGDDVVEHPDWPGLVIRLGDLRL